MSEKTLLRVKDLKVEFYTEFGTVQAIRGVDFELREKETLAIVGESGSGKSVTSKAIMGLLAQNGKISEGSIELCGKDITNLKEEEYLEIRGREIAMIFQDPMTSLNPTMTIGKQLIEGIILHQKKSKQEAKEEAKRLLELVGISNPELRLKQYPHQFSGGMRQRIVIAIALGCNPKVLIADEPTTALDVTIQAQIIELIKDIQKKTGVAVIFITHDLGVVANVADYVAVMYAGKIVEKGTVDEVFYNAKHPYTWGLLASMPSIESKNAELFVIPGTPPNLLNPPQGDAFAARNKWALDIDFEEEPPYFKISATHYAATWLLDERSPRVEMPDIVKRRVDEAMLLLKKGVVEHE